MKDKEADAKKQIYEVGYHLMPTVSAAEIANLVVKIRSVIEEKGGEIISEEMPSLRTIAYEISTNTDNQRQKFSKSFFGWIKFEINNFSIDDVKQSLKKVVEIMRFILVKTAKESTIFQPKFQRVKRDIVDSDTFDAPKIKNVSEEEIDKGIEQLVLS